MTVHENVAAGPATVPQARKSVETWASHIVTKRSIFRWIHIIFSIPILGYIYSPFEAIPNYAPATRYFFVPALVLSGLWMWKGHVVRRFLSKRPA